MRTLLLAAVVALVATTGCSKVECTDGTFRDGNNCVPYDPDDHDAPVTTISPDGARTRDPLPTLVTLTSSEPATIYFTTDGRDPDPTIDPPHRDRATVVGIAQNTTIKYLSVDLAGNQEAVRTATYDSDNVAPARVANLSLGFTDTTADLTWANPTDPDYVGTVIARVHDLVDADPDPGSTVAPGTMLSPSLEIVANGTMTEFHDPDRPPGPVRYVAWTYDDLGNYSRPVAALGELSIGATTLQVDVALATDTATVVQAPDHFTVTATASHASTNLTLNLSITNDTERYLQNPKLEVVTTTSTSLTSPSGTADGHPFKTLGPNMFAPHTTIDTTLTMGGLTATTTESIHLTLATHPAIVAARGSTRGMIQIRDFGSGQSLDFDAGLTGPQGRVGGRMRPSLAVGQHIVDVASSHGIARIDMTTRTLVSSLAFDDGAVQALLSTGSEEIALLKFGTRRSSGPVTVVRLDEGLHIKSKVTLPFEDSRGFPLPGLSPDSSQLAIPLPSGLALVDLDSMTPIDLLPETPDIVEALDVGISGRLRSATYFGSGTTAGIAVVGRDSGTLTLVHPTETGFETQVVNEPTAVRGMGAVVAPSDSRVWIAFDNVIDVYDPNDGSLTTVPYPFVSDGISVIDGKVWIHRRESSKRSEKIDEINEATGAVVKTMTTATNIGMRGHWTTVAR